MALLLANGCISFRAICKIFVAMNTCLNLNLRVPSHSTVLNWMKKQGVSNLKGKYFFTHQKWVLIMDESVQFGKKKLLVVLAVPESRLRLQEALSYSDMVPLVIKASDTWKADCIQKEILSKIDIGQISYVVADNGNNLKSCCHLMRLQHIEDVGHKFSWFAKKVFGGQTDFEGYTKYLAGLRGKLSLTKFSHIIPPGQRVISRYMNLTPLFEWGCRILGLLDSGSLDKEESEKVAFVQQYRAFILQTAELLAAMNNVQQILKTKQLCEQTVAECCTIMDAVKDDRGMEMASMINDYLRYSIKKCPIGGEGLCSSDIIESCFGKYKEMVKSNKSMGVTDLCLCISSITTTSSFEQTKQMLEQVKIADIKLWKDENIGESLLAKRNNLFKKNRVKKIKKKT